MAIKIAVSNHHFFKFITAFCRFILAILSFFGGDTPDGDCDDWADSGDDDSDSGVVTMIEQMGAIVVSVVLHVAWLHNSIYDLLVCQGKDNIALPWEWSLKHQKPLSTFSQT